MVTTNANLVALPTPELRCKKDERFATEEEANALVRFASLKDEIEELDTERKSVGEWLCSVIVDDKVRFSGGRASVTRVEGRESFNLKAFLLAHPEMAEEAEKYKTVSDPYSFIRLSR